MGSMLALKAQRAASSSPEPIKPAQEFMPTTPGLGVGVGVGAAEPGRFPVPLAS